jgi:hypothetical protein
VIVIGGQGDWGLPFVVHLVSPLVQQAVMEHSVIERKDLIKTNK